jgi:alanyl-tRNA synthetase
VTVFAGDADAPRDDDSAETWRRLGIPNARIYFMPKKDNWWGPAGATGPCGPDSEIFYDTGTPDHPGCAPGCACGKWFEIWNNVFMEYNKTGAGQYVKLRQQNVDTGMGVDRTVAALRGYDDVFLVDTLAPLIAHIEELTGRRYADNPRAFRIIADHARAATFAIADGATPSNVEAGYIVRRLVRRAVRYGRELGIAHTPAFPRSSLCADLSGIVVNTFAHAYPELEQNRARVAAELEREEAKFQDTLARGLREYHKRIESVQGEGNPTISAADAFDLFETYGFPLSLTVELAREQGLSVDQAGFETLYQEHKEMSRRGSEHKFKGGLADHAAETTRLHTATHLLHQALRQVLGASVHQMGSNITAERLRFDFSHAEKLTPEQIRKVEEIVNAQIAHDLPVSVQVMSLDQATGSGALAFFGEKYGDQVKVYSIGAFSEEVCGGPHVARTSELGKFKITKQEAVGQGVRRVRAVLEKTAA